MKEMKEIIADLEARHAADRPPVSDDVLEYVRALEVQRDEARRDYAACAHAIGVEYEADGRASQPGPVADALAGKLREAERDRDGAREALGVETANANALAHKVAQMQRVIDEFRTVDIPAHVAEIDRLRFSIAGAEKRAEDAEDHAERLRAAVKGAMSVLQDRDRTTHRGLPWAFSLANELGVALAADTPAESETKEGP